MIHIKATTTNEAWKQALMTLESREGNLGLSKYSHDELAVIEITSPAIEPIHPLFPMHQSDIDLINNFITTGEGEDGVVHEWTKLYFHRIFDEPFSQIEYLISKLQAPTPKGDAVISLWDKHIDQDAKVNPCTLIIWARIKKGKLELHVHAHSSDAYKKLLMNIQEFIALQTYLSTRLSLENGSYFHILDSCHIHTEDLEKVREVISLFAE